MNQVTREPKTKNYAHEQTTPEQGIGFLLWYISTSWRTAIETVLEEYDLTHPQFVVLAALGWLTQDNEKVNQASIGKMISLDPNTTSQILKGLEAKKFIKRVVSLDARSKHPVLTTRGSNILVEALPAVETADRQFFNVLTKSEIELLTKLFGKLSFNRK